MPVCIAAAFLRRIGWQVDINEGSFTELVDRGFTNGHSQRSDLLLACDGVRSRLRGQIAPLVQPTYSGYYLWRGAPAASGIWRGQGWRGGASLSSHDDIDRALAAYNAERQQLSEMIVSHGRKLGTRLGVDLKRDDECANSCKIPTPS
jgi:2-polyprenyl-6-methoxyphenol hydroxylase-like FAD-dependent oxidoreductase